MKNNTPKAIAIPLIWKCINVPFLVPIGSIPNVNSIVVEIIKPEINNKVKKALKLKVSIALCHMIYIKIVAKIAIDAKA